MQAFIAILVNTALVCGIGGILLLSAPKAQKVKK